jgi:hypothetical protein
MAKSGVDYSEQSTLAEFSQDESVPEFHPPVVPLPLTKSEPENGGASYRLKSNLNHQIEKMGIDHVSFVDIGIDPPIEEEEVPLLVVMPITDAERSEVQFDRKISRENERNAAIRLPPRMLREGQHHVSLELDLDSYSNSNRLIFRAIPMSNLFGLAPVGYEDGTKYTHAPI